MPAALQFAWPAILALLVSSAVCAFFVRSRGAYGPVDIPNERSLHIRPVPRSGGVGIVLGILPGLLWPVPATPLLVPLVLLAIVSFLDDLAGLRPTARLLAQFVAAALFITLSGVAFPWWLWTLLVIGTVWCANLYNFMDGMDGLAGGMAVIGFGSYAFAAGSAGHDELATFSAATAAAAAGFLFFNFSPARIFMGDAGSVPLGFLAAALGVSGWTSGAWPAWFPGVVFAPFAVDATLTLVRRILRRERIWAAHKTHYYQRLVRLGLGHRRTALLEYALMAGSALVALWALGRTPSVQAAAIAGLALVYAGLAYAVDSAWRHRGEASA